jgi:hypothetical protein
MSTVNTTITKMDVVIDIIFKHDREMPSCEHKFSEIMDEIIQMWRLNEEKVGKVESFPTLTLPTLQNIGQGAQTKDG